MCRKKRVNWLGYAAVIVGGLILMILILPRWIWWLLCGGILLAGGIFLLRR